MDEFVRLKKRDSNIELLRVIAMLGIIASHITSHCVIYQLTDSSSILKWNNGVFNYPFFYKRLLLIQGILPLGKVANVIFVLISGFYMIGNGKQINFGKISSKLLLQLGWITIVMTVCSMFYWIWYGKNANVSVSLWKITDFNSTAWFIGYYFIIVLICGLFFNQHISKLEQINYRNLLIVLFALVSFEYSGGVLDSLADGLRTVICGIFIYMLGGYIRIYNPFKRIRIGVLVILIVVVFLSLFVSYYNMVNTSIKAFTQDMIMLGKEKNSDICPFNQEIIRFENYGIITLMLGIAFFEIFKRLSIPNSRIINLLGASTFMIYIFHDNEFWWNIWRGTDWISILYNKPMNYCVMIIQWTCFLFGLGLVIYLAYVVFARIICKHLNIS